MRFRPSDRDEAYFNKLRLLDVESGRDEPTCRIDGWVEYQHWSTDGNTLLLGVAGLGADLAGAQGGRSIAAKDASRPAWMPEIDAGTDETTWRSVWLYDVASDTARKISPVSLNTWEAVWCGPDRIAAICSDAPGEAQCYTASLRLFDLEGNASRVLFTPKDQLGWVAASPSGSRVAVVEAVCSDRTIVAGDLRIIDVASEKVSSAETLGADVVQAIWRGENHVLFAGLQALDSVIGIYDCNTAKSLPAWRDRNRTPSGGRFPEIASLGIHPADCLFACEGFFEPQRLIALKAGVERKVMQFVSSLDSTIARASCAESVFWRAPDGLEIQGWLLKPGTPGPHALVLNVHGGLVWLFRPRYLGQNLQLQMLLDAGYAVLQANPRGSSGRGQEFARAVYGDMGGADTHDLLSGLDAMVERGIADSVRLGVTGGSYGGFMSSWLITQGRRFAAAVAVAPVTDWVCEHLTCHIPLFCEMFLADEVDDPTGKYFTRSPIHYAHRAKTPTLNICGALDKNTPAVQALEFHHALQAHGVQSVLATYPLEGHGVRTMPAVFDYRTRLIAWFTMHMPAKPDQHAVGVGGGVQARIGLAHVSCHGLSLSVHWTKFSLTRCGL